MDAKRILFDTVYVPIMKRWGADDGHHYLVGIYNSLDKATSDAEEERNSRGGKYEYVIEQYEINQGRGGIVDEFRVGKSKHMPVLLDDEREDFIKEYEKDKDTKKYDEHFYTKELARLKEQEEKLKLELNEVEKQKQEVVTYYESRKEKAKI